MAQGKLLWNEQWLLSPEGAAYLAQLHAENSDLAARVLRLELAPGVISALVWHDGEIYQVTLKLPSAEVAAQESFQAVLSAHENWRATNRADRLTKKLIACALAYELNLFLRLDEVQVSCTCHNEAEAEAESKVTAVVESKAAAAGALCPQVAAVITLVEAISNDESYLLLLLTRFDLEALLGRV